MWWIANSNCSNEMVPTKNIEIVAQRTTRKPRHTLISPSCMSWLTKRDANEFADNLCITLNRNVEQHRMPAVYLQSDELLIYSATIKSDASRDPHSPRPIYRRPPIPPYTFHCEGPQRLVEPPRLRRRARRWHWQENRPVPLKAIDRLQGVAEVDASKG